MSISVEHMALLRDHVMAAGDNARYPVQAEIEAAKRRAARDGMGGGFVHAIVTILAQANQRAAADIESEIRTLCTTLHIPVESSDTAQLQSLALSALVDEAIGDALLRANVPSSFPENALLAGSDLIVESNTRLRASLERNVRLLVLQHIAARQSMAQPPGSNTFNIQGNVGALQTGEGATANVHQGLTGDDLSKVAHQFAILIEELRKVSPDRLPNRDALVQEAQACEADVNAGKPDTGRIRALIKGGIGVVKDVPALIESAQAIASAFGFQLPGS
ncbi:hypothetical protein [Caballeronia terrestris]|nr:hypothetical protein [Caballeronia terrestris]